MAKTLFSLFLLTLFITFTFTKSDTYSKLISPSSLNLNKEILTHLHFYFHDILDSKDPTAVIVAEAPITNTSTVFGSVAIADDPLTSGPEISSKLIGKAQGMYAGASQAEIGFMMVFNFAFFEGKFKGSMLSLLGRNVALNKVREMPIVGGTGDFRFARGYAQARTISRVNRNAVVEYKITKWHISITITTIRHVQSSPL